MLWSRRLTPGRLGVEPESPRSSLRAVGHARMLGIAVPVSLVSLSKPLVGAVDTAVWLELQASKSEATRTAMSSPTLILSQRGRMAFTQRGSMHGARQRSAESTVQLGPGRRNWGQTRDKSAEECPGSDP